MHLTYKIKQGKKQKEKKRVISVKASEYENLIKLIESTNCAKIVRNRNSIKIYIEQQEVKPAINLTNILRKQKKLAIRSNDLVNLPNKNMKKNELYSVACSEQGQCSAIISK